MRRYPFFQQLFTVAMALLFAQQLPADMLTISTATSLSNTGLGTGNFTPAYAPIGGTLTRSSPGQITELVQWSGDGFASTGTSVDTISEFLSLLETIEPGITSSPVTAVVLSFGVQEPGSGSVDMTELDVTFGTFSLSFNNAPNADLLTVFSHGSGGSQAEAFIQVNFGTDITTLAPGALFSISGVLANADGGPERLFLTDVAPAAIPEPSAFLFGGLLCGVLGMCVAGRRLLRTWRGR
jgi:hypothetical protein